MAVLEDLERFGNEGAASSGGQEHRPYDESSRFNDQDKGGDRLSTGQPWATMARIVRGVDEQKIKHYKEDIDSILVFAGLFSSVMTSLLVESYKSLSQDPDTVKIMLLQQIASQTHSYSLTSSSLDSTTPPLAQPTEEFRPSTNAVLVNVLWFASLTLSLVSASLAILVKQWLREYLAGEHTSPQAHLRIRHFRNPGLQHWKVFEIAAVIPLLLQLCLALFLVGLCCFTAAVHSTIGHTTIPLVAGWGLLILSVTLAPIFSPRCPYKTSLLLYPMAYIRKRLVKTLQWVTQDCTPFEELATRMPVPGGWSYRDMAYQEENVVKTDSNDIEILVTVDAIQGDEHLLDVMWDALKQARLKAIDQVRFVRQIIRNRVPSNTTDYSIAPSASLSYDLTYLQPSTLTSVMLMVAEILEAPLDVDGRTEQWMNECVDILLTDTNIPIPSAVNGVLLRILSHPIRYKPLFDIISESAAKETTAFSVVLKRLRGAYISRSIEHNRVMETLVSLLRKIFCSDHATVSHDLIDIARDHDTFTIHHSHEIALFLIDLITHRTSNSDKPWQVNILLNFQVVLGLLRVSESQHDTQISSWRPYMVGLVQHLLSTAPGVLVLCPFAMGLRTKLDNMLDWATEELVELRSLRPEAQQLIIDALNECNGAARPQMIANLSSQVAHQWHSPRKTLNDVKLVDPLDVCHLALRLLVTMTVEEKLIDSTMEREIRDLFKKTCKGPRGGQDSNRGY